MKLVFLDADTMGDVSLAAFAELGEFVSYPNSTPQQALERVADCNVLLLNKVRVTAELLDRAPQLRLVCVAATGVNNIDLEACKARGVVVRNVAGYSTESVVQITFMHILSLVGHAPYYDASVKDGRYSRSEIFSILSNSFHELDGKRIGIIGMGTIGSRVAQVAQAFGMDVVYYSTSGTSHCTEYPSLPLDDLLRTSDIVSIHAPLNERTRGLLGGRELALMKPSAFLVNVGRGYIVDETALAQAVDDGVIAGAGLDVFAVEPLPADSPLMNVKHPERFHFSPHIAWASIEARTRLVQRMVQNIRESYREDN
jgi:lactate dehydrogenase-like 2-hydroxyacid dehydrogenase